MGSKHELWTGRRLFERTVGVHSKAELIEARERIRAVLEPELGRLSALERANNITQALSLSERAPLDVALALLGSIQAQRRPATARAVDHAWRQAEAARHRYD